MPTESYTTPTEDEDVAFGELTLEQRRTLGGEIDKEYDLWLQRRRPHEMQWFVNAAYRNGKHTSESLQTLTTIQDLAKLERKKKNIANKLWAKGRARFAKFVKNRPRPVVVPFTHERQDRLDSRATERALNYQYERGEQEQKYHDVILWANDTGKAYWFYHWNASKNATIRVQDPLTQKSSIEDVPEGDIEIEVASGFEVLVPDVRASRLKNQPKMIRARVQDVDEMRSTYEGFAEFIKPDAHLGSPFRYERQIANLSSSEAGTLASVSSDQSGPQTGVLVKEEYTKANYKYPKGRYVVVISGIAVKVQEELPFGFYDMENPYPCTDFQDTPQVGRYYTTTFIEQLIPLQRGYNILRDKLEQQIRLNVNPKWMVTRQARIPKGSLTNESSEVVEWNYIPGMPEPHSITPGNIAADAWRFAQLLEKEFDDISQIFPSAEGKVGASKSGFQTNLLQEASDNVHSPDARGFELAMVDSAYKLRRMMKLGYTVPRLLSFAGRNSIPEVFEFSSKNIDEHASIVVQIGSGLSHFKAARIQQLLELFDKGLLGDPANPDVKRRVLSLMDMGGVEEFQERAARDEELARMEDIDILEGKEIPVPQFYEDHRIHYDTHTEELKNPANKSLDEGIRKRLIAHTLLHMRFFNPAAAYNLALEMGLNKLIESGLIKSPQQIPPPVAGGQAPTPAGAPATPTPTQ